MDNNSKAYSYLIKLLSARDYSEHKLKEKLREKVRAQKFTAEEAEAALIEVKERGYLREEVYAEARMKAFMHKGYSPNFIRQKLGQEHLVVTNDDIGEVFEEHRLSVDDQIERLARKKLGSKTEIDFNEESKILRFLLSKGHDFSNSKKVLKSILQELKEH